jgi:peptidoglycan/xylan/chitin deacetylase (PgdA/CDA1 family)
LSKFEIQIDCDDFWIYQQDDSLRFNQNKKFDIFEESIKNILEHLSLHNLTATFFVVGRDIEINKNAINVIKYILKLGHDVGNHTFNHSRNYHNLTQNDAKLEIINNHEIIRKVFNHNCTKFRAPGYNFRNDQITTLEILGYKFEDSTWPSRIVPLLNLYFRVLARSSKRIYNRWQSGTQENNVLNFRKIMVIRWLKLPFHVTFFDLYPKFIIKFILKLKLIDGEIFLIHAKDYLTIKANERENIKKIDLVLDFIAKQNKVKF